MSGFNIFSSWSKGAFNWFKLAFDCSGSPVQLFTWLTLSHLSLVTCSLTQTNYGSDIHLYSSNQRWRCRCVCAGLLLGPLITPGVFTRTWSAALKRLSSVRSLPLVWGSRLQMNSFCRSDLVYPQSSSQQRAGVEITGEAFVESSPLNDPMSLRLTSGFPHAALQTPHSDHLSITPPTGGHLSQLLWMKRGNTSKWCKSYC